MNQNFNNLLDAITNSINNENGIASDRHRNDKRVVWPLLNLLGGLSLISFAGGVFIGISTGITGDIVDIGTAITSGILVFGGAAGGLVAYGGGGSSKGQELKELPELTVVDEEDDE